MEGSLPTRLSVELSPNLLGKLRQKAKENHRTIKGELEIALEKHLQLPATLPVADSQLTGPVETASERKGV